MLGIQYLLHKLLAMLLSKDQGHDYNHTHTKKTVQKFEKKTHNTLDISDGFSPSTTLNEMNPVEKTQDMGFTQ